MTKEKKRKREDVSITRNVKIAKLLTAPEREIRNKALDVVEKYLKSKSTFTELDFMKLWKALYYCLWMADKQNVQNEISNRIASFQRSIGDNIFLYIETFYKTMLREWSSIDKHRLDKYLYLVRIFFGTSLQILHENNWNEDMLVSFNEVMLRTALSTDLTICRRGLIFHFCDIFVDEVSKVLGQHYYCTLDIDTIFKIFLPFLSIVVQTREKTITAKIDKEIIEEFLSHLIDLSNDEESEADVKADRLDTFVQFLTKIETYFKDHAKAKETPERNRGTLYAMSKTIRMNIDENK